MEKRKFSIKEMFSKRPGKKNSKHDLDGSNESLNGKRESDVIRGRIYIRVIILLFFFYNYDLINLNFYYLILFNLIILLLFKINEPPFYYIKKYYQMIKNLKFIHIINLSIINIKFYKIIFNNIIFIVG